MFFDNVLYSEKLKKRYVGSTNDVNKRLSEHNSGKSKFTKGGIPWKIVYTESFETNSEARAREKFLKSGQGRKFLDQKLK
jgi:putative endonuclease